MVFYVYIFLLLSAIGAGVYLVFHYQEYADYIIVTALVGCLVPFLIILWIKSRYEASLEQRQQEVNDVLLKHNKEKFGKYGVFWNLGQYGAWICAKINQSPLTDMGSEVDSVMGGGIINKPERFHTNKLDSSKSVVEVSSQRNSYADEEPVKQSRKKSVS